MNDATQERASMINRRNSNDEKTIKSGNRQRHRDVSVAHTVPFQPWFLPQRIAFAIHGLVPVHFQKKMRYFFEDYGCMICGTESRYHSNGMCRLCYARTLKRIQLSVRRRSRANPRQRLDLLLFRQEKLARRLLKDFPQKRFVHPKARRIEPERCNPVYEALSARHE